MLTVSVAVMNPDKELFRKFLYSLKNFTPEMSQLLISNNGSDDPWMIVEEVFPNGCPFDIHIKNYGKNVGFGKAHNDNAFLAEGKYFAVLNDDIEFFENWSTSMIEKLESDPQIAQVGMKTGVCNTWNAKAEAGWTNTPEYIEGSCFLMRTELARQYGPFDDIYKVAYYEDGDLSLRLRKDGYSLSTVDVKWVHHRAKTSGTVDIDIEGYHVKNEHTFKNRWSGYLHSKRFIDLVIFKRTGSYGDVFLLEPVISAFKKQNDCLIGLMSDCSEMIINSPDIAGRAESLRPVYCNRLIDFDYAYEKDFRKHIIDAYAEVAGVIPERKHGKLYIPEPDVINVQKALKEDRDYVVLEMSDTWGSKQWGKKQYQELIAELHNDGHLVYGMGISEQYYGDIGLDKNYMNLFNIMETAAFMSYAKLFIGHEGLLGHFAQALNMPHVLLYGCTSPEYVSDTSLDTWRGVVSPVGCQGCRHVYAAGVGVDCRRKDFPCMKAITTEMVYSKYKELVNENILCAS